MLIFFQIDGPADVPIKQTGRFLSEADALAYLQRRQREGRQFAASRQEKRRENTKQNTVRCRMITRNRHRTQKTELKVPSNPLAVTTATNY